MHRSDRRLSRISARMFKPEARFYAFVIFFVILFLTGGGSRDDIQSLIVLRPLAVLFCVYALIAKAPEQWSGRSFPVYIAGALAVVMVVQLVPLPPSIWTGLPGRQIFADIANLADIEQPWRPLTLSPSRTLNSLFSLAVPIAAMMLYLNLDRMHRKRAILAIIILCAISALWAVFQIMGPAQGPLYLYRITNFGTGVGLFANRNHQAAMLAVSIVTLGWYAASLNPREERAVLKFYGCLATIFVFIPLIFITGSRAGLLLMIPALLLVLFLVYFGKYHADPSAKKSGNRSASGGLLSDRRMILVLGVAAISAMVVLSILLSRSLAFDRLFSGDQVAELRVQLLPTLFTMTKDYMPWGSGFGSFEHVYKIYETQELLMPSYLNQAHNDWLQFPIEGGIPAVLVTLAGFFWFLAKIATLVKSWNHSGFTKYRVLMCVAVILFLLAASIGDYPLRVPSIIAIFAVLICVFNDGVRSVQRRDIQQL
ncbi:O-antigen ligase-related domain-containing protein [Parasphingorhabdus sp. NYA22]